MFAIRIVAIVVVVFVDSGISCVAIFIRRMSIQFLQYSCYCVFLFDLFLIFGQLKLRERTINKVNKASEALNRSLVRLELLPSTRPFGDLSKISYSTKQNEFPCE